VEEWWSMGGSSVSDDTFGRPVVLCCGGKGGVEVNDDGGAGAAANQKIKRYFTNPLDAYKPCAVFYTLGEVTRTTSKRGMN
jgi:hypothetical protein